MVSGDDKSGCKCIHVTASWHMLQEIEQKQMAPELYPYNSRGPVGSHYLAAKYGVRWGDMTDNPEEVI